MISKKLLLLISYSAIVTTCGCSTLAPISTYTNLDQLHTETDPKLSTLTSYDITGGVWVKDQPLLINKEFNFGMAMSIEGAGTAIAVGMRNNKNESLTAELSSMPDLNLNQRFDEVLRSKNIEINDVRVSVFGLLYGQPLAQLRTIVELREIDSSNPRRFIAFSTWRAATGENSWANNSGKALWEYFDIAFNQISGLMGHYPTTGIKGGEIQFGISGGESLSRGKGYLLAQNQNHVLLESTNMLNTLLLVPAEITTILAIEPLLPIEP